MSQMSQVRRIKGSLTSPCIIHFSQICAINRKTHTSSQTVFKYLQSDANSCNLTKDITRITADIRLSPREPKIVGNDTYHFVTVTQISSFLYFLKICKVVWNYRHSNMKIWDYSGWIITKFKHQLSAPEWDYHFSCKRHAPGTDDGSTQT